MAGDGERSGDEQQENQSQSQSHHDVDDDDGYYDPPSASSRTPLATIPDPHQRSSTSTSKKKLAIKGKDVTRPDFLPLVVDPSFWSHHNVQVLVRIRPPTPLEDPHSRCLKQLSPSSLLWLPNPDLRFTFDHVACESLSQQELFNAAGIPIVDNCISGYNSCMFAYGQTGSGKTYTMLGGDLNRLHHPDLGHHCGIAPRLFHYLFSRIQTEQERRRDEKISFSCKCSFLEIYNEQITDLLEPSSTNLQIREDSHKGVYVENLKECTAQTANDAIKLLLEGASNRKISPTCMNGESSRSHSVFTCVIESRWEKDSVTHYRFARLNLVDLAGSERQKSSGAEGDRLKEAANINKSLSTLGLVIMSLVDLAHGKQRHVPYRDSRLTFLLQDSLGGNSKTTIIANVSPSICSANETLSTLKFAQRAKLIQNNAKVNEDASGDVYALQQQIQQLKHQMSFLVKQPEVANHCNSLTIPKGESQDFENQSIQQRACQREENVQRAKRRLHFQAKKIKQLELLLHGSLSADSYLSDENKNLKEEIKLLLALIEESSVSALCALENGSLLEQLDSSQNSNCQVQQMTLLAEFPQLQNQVESTPYGNDFGIEVENNSNGMVIPNPSGQQSNTHAEILVNRKLTVSREEKACLQLGTHSPMLPNAGSRNKRLTVEGKNCMKCTNLHIELDKLTKELKETKLLNFKFENDLAALRMQNLQTGSVCEQVEMETSRTILHLQDEVTILQSELAQRLSHLTDENIELNSMIRAKEEENKRLCREWEQATTDLTSFLLEGSKSLDDVYREIAIIAKSFPQGNMHISEHVEKAVRACIDREQVTLQLEKCLEDAQEMIAEMELKVDSLKQATIAMNKFPESDDDQKDGEMICLRMLLSEKIDLLKTFEEKLKWKEDRIKEAEKLANASFLLAKWLYDALDVSHQNHVTGDTEISNLLPSFEMAEGKTPKMKVDELESLIFLSARTQLQMLQILWDDSKKINERLAMVVEYVSSCGYLLPANNYFKVDSQSVSSFSSGSSTSASDYLSEGEGQGSKLDGFLSKHDSGISGQNTKKCFGQKYCSVMVVDCVENSMMMTTCLRQELDVAFDAFKNLYTRLNSVLDDNDIMEPNACFDPETLGKEVAVHDENTKEMIVNGKLTDGTTFLKKCEEVHATMVEADQMLNALIEVNQYSGRLNKQLNSSLTLSNEENSLLNKEINDSLSEVGDLVSTFGACFSKIQREVEDCYEGLFFDLSSIGREILSSIRDSRSFLEGIHFNILEKGFFECTVHQYLAGEVLHRFSSFSLDASQFRKHECPSDLDALCLLSLNDHKDVMTANKESEEGNQEETLCNSEGMMGISHDDLECENICLKRRLQRSESLLKGLIFDFRLLQETTASKKDSSDMTEKLAIGLNEVRLELKTKTSQFDDILARHKELECYVMEVENALSVSSSELALANRRLDIFSNENANLRMLAKDLYLQKSEVENHLDEQKEVVRGLEEEVIRWTSTIERKGRSSVHDLEEQLRKTTKERDEFHEEVRSLHDKLEVAYALADENAALAIKACQDSEASKSHAERKEEEVTILESSVEELECTINMLEQKVLEMEKEVDGHRKIRDSLEMELPVMRQRLSKVELLSDAEYRGRTYVQIEDRFPRQSRCRLIELQEANNQITGLERIITEKDEEIKQLKEYIGELMLHSEAQTLQFQEKYKSLKAMIQGVKFNLTHPTSTGPVLGRNEKGTVRTRGSSSPFRCIASLMQQMNVEKEEELSITRLRVEDLEAALAGRQQEVCALNARLAATESMTHDVIRDLLDVKLDMTKYASMIDQNQIQKLLEDTYEKMEEHQAKEHENLKMKKRIDELNEERERCLSELDKKCGDIISLEMSLEQLQQQDQLLYTENEMLKKDRSKMLRRLAELG